MRKRGFTLVEIMIVVAIIALLAAIAIPNLLRARMQANESAAIAAVKTAATAEITYRTGNATYGTLAELGAAVPPYIDAQLAAGTKSGYTFTDSDIDADAFCVSAVPTSANSGQRCFCTTEDGVVRVNATANCAAPTRAVCVAGGDWTAIQ